MSRCMAAAALKSVCRCYWGSPAAQRVPKSAVGQFLILLRQIHEGEGTHTGETSSLEEECHQQLTCLTSALCRRARNYPHEHLHGTEPGGTFPLMRILFILSGATNLLSEHFVLIKN